MLHQCTSLQLVSLLANNSWRLSTLNLSNSTVGTWSYHLTPQEVWERRQKKVDSFIRDPADSRDPRKGVPAPSRPNPRMHSR